MFHQRNRKNDRLWIVDWFREQWKELTNYVQLVMAIERKNLGVPHLLGKFVMTEGGAEVSSSCANMWSFLIDYHTEFFC